MSVQNPPASRARLAGQPTDGRAGVRRPIRFLGKAFTSEAEFMQAFPAYGSHGCIRAIRAGCETPHEVEVWLYEQSPEARRRMRDALRRNREQMAKAGLTGRGPRSKRRRAA